MDNKTYIDNITKALERAVIIAKTNTSGQVADYIPELKKVDANYIAGAIRLQDGEFISAGDDKNTKFTLQSVSKLVLLIGLMEEFGSEKVFSWINAEPSGQPFAAIGYLDKYGAVPSNPLINAGALVLSGRIPGNQIEQLEWVKRWTNKIFATELSFNEDVFHSELLSADRNRSLAYLMKSTGVLLRDIEEILLPYCALCSYEVSIEQATYLPMLLANGGLTPNGERIFSEQTGNQVVAIMATCGLYNESGMHLVKTGLAAKSSVSGLIIAVATGRGGIAVLSPRLNEKGNSIRGNIILDELSNCLGWHFAAPWVYARTDSKLHKNCN